MRFKGFIFLFALLFICLLSFDFATAAVSNNPTDGPLTFQARVEYQRAIEEVYWRHRIWPKENPGVKPSLEKILPDSAIIAKVEDYLRKSNALEQYWKRPIAAQQLQAEMDRMVKNTKQPQLLKEIFSALNNDPHLIAECLARPAIVDRLIHNWYANDDRFHGGLRQRVQNELLGLSTQSMHGLSGKYLEVQRVKETDSKLLSDPLQIALNTDEWKDWTENLQAIFGKQIPIEKLSEIQEDIDRIYVMSVLEKGSDKIRIATVEWPKTTFDSWWSDERERTPIEISEEFVAYTLKPLDASSSCVDDTWTPTRAPFPEGRLGHTAVWTGTEMIVWGGTGSSRQLSSGARYDPATDSWMPTSESNVPAPRAFHTAIWTGTEMIVWGGEYPQLSSGGKYDPSTDSWAATSNINVPVGRAGHTVVWTGNEMIVWGGWSWNENENGDLSSGGRYDPSNDSWKATSNINVPDRREAHTAVWTGSEMIIWGGVSLPTGGRYNPSFDSWTATSMVNAPEARSNHTAVWTGTEMIVWGGEGNGLLSTGGRYDPVADIWVTTSNIDAPLARKNHTAVWTGTVMIIWGGWWYYGPANLSTGGRYDPTSDSWTPTSLANVPDSGRNHSAVWTGDEMIIWGGLNETSGYLYTGGRYDPSSDIWVATSSWFVPDARGSHSAIWTGAEMIVWGGRYMFVPRSGGRYYPATDSWTPTTANSPVERNYHTAIWNGIEMIIWGGYSNEVSSTGGRYNPSTDSWIHTENFNAPDPRYSHSAVWTGVEMIVWGGKDLNNDLSTGGRYDPSSDSWTLTTITNVPEGRFGHTAVWTGTEMIVWGGITTDKPFSSGGRYNPTTDSWVATSKVNVPDERAAHTAVWTGAEMIVWGGRNGDYTLLSSGGRYNPYTDNWRSISNKNVPESREFHTVAWTGTEMIIWGGNGPPEDNLFSGGRYDPSRNSWTATSNLNAPKGRANHTAIWTGNHMIVWGGDGLQTGGLYCAISPEVVISDVSLMEEDNGYKKFEFLVTLSTPLDFNVKVEYATADGTATEAGNDFMAKSGTKRIRRGQTTTTVKIKVKGDKIPEADEIFTVNLTNAVGAAIADPQAVATIMNDD